jgi:hypothetical protein
VAAFQCAGKVLSAQHKLRAKRALYENHTKKVARARRQGSASVQIPRGQATEVLREMMHSGAIVERAVDALSLHP